MSIKTNLKNLKSKYRRFKQEFRWKIGLRRPKHGAWAPELSLKYLMATNQIPKNKILQNKFAFESHFSGAIGHFENIWKHLDKNSFDIICCCSTKEENDLIKEYAQKNEYTALYMEDALKSKYKYKAIVSNFYTIGGKIKHKETIYYGFQLLADKQIRITYSLGASAWNYSDWNKYYDMILCNGPTDAESFKQCSNAVIKQIGYPRFDDYFNNPVNKEEVLKSFGLNLDKKTIVYLPSITTMNSISEYIDKISELSLKYNTIVKPHPKTSKEELEILKNSNIDYKIFDTAYNNQTLFAIADYVMVDVGGSVFGAIYTDKNVLILNIKDIEKVGEIGENSEDLKVKEYLVNINPDDDIEVVLSNNKIWEGQIEPRKQLREKYFKPYFGNSSQKAAEYITEYFNSISED